MKYDVMGYDVMTYDVLTYDVMTYDIMTYDVLTYDAMIYADLQKRVYIGHQKILEVAENSEQITLSKCRFFFIFL